ncbi:MAG: hypothetical protein DDT20_01586 [Firmicutes bacterium]|nr:hypothetical protein [Bacillota bacterium]
MGALGLVRLAGKGLGVAVKAGVLGLSLKASRQAAVRAFAAELRAANLPPATITELCDMYPNVNFASLLRQRPAQEQGLPEN